MRLLLDTHAFLWFINNDSRLSEARRQTIRNTQNSVFLSVISVWEAAVKFRLGKLPMPSDPAVFLPAQRERHGIASLHLDERSVTELLKLPPLHRDPFDRMLICQALANDLTLVTNDLAIQNYPIETLAC